MEDIPNIVNNVMRCKKYDPGLFSNENEEILSLIKEKLSKINNEEFLKSKMFYEKMIAKMSDERKRLKGQYSKSKNFNKKTGWFKKLYTGVLSTLTTGKKEC